MGDRFDDLVGRLAQSPTDRDLDGLEGDVRGQILIRRQEARTNAVLAPVRVATIGLALAMGVIAGGLTAAAAVAAPRSSGVFSSAADLAPSTLLEGRQ